ncbi:MAG: hypothetical protein ACO1TH_09120 [Luteitalea sp.]
MAASTVTRPAGMVSVVDAGAAPWGDVCRDAADGQAHGRKGCQA